MVGLAVGVITPLGIFVVTELLGLPKESLQWLMMANGIAMLVGGGLVMGFAKNIAPQKLMAAGLFASAVSVAGIGLSTNFWLTLALQFFCGLFLPCIHVGISTLILRTAEEEFVGRVNGVLNPLFMGGMVTAMSIAGWLKSKLALVAIYEISGILFLGGVLLIIPLARVFVQKDDMTGSLQGGD